MNERVPKAEWVVKESPIGVFPLAEAATTAAVDIPSRKRLLEGLTLMVPPVQGETREDPALVAQVADELGSMVGGSFLDDLTPFITLHDSLVSPELRQYYASGGMSISWDQPRTAFSWLVFRTEGWQVQAAGDPGDFHCVSFGRPLRAEGAIGAGSHPLPHPLGPVEPLLETLAPRVAERPLTDHSDEHAPNVFDTFLTAAGVTVKGGVRMRVDEAGTPVGDAPYHYALRVNIELPGAGP